MHEAAQLDLLQNAFPLFRSEYDRLAIDPTEDPFEPCLNNPMFNATDALVYYCMVRHFRPNVVLEVGAGFSSRLSARAALMNRHPRLICIEPQPDPVLAKGFPGLTSVVSQPIQDVGFEVFQQLGTNDILFVDSSHVVNFGSDVNHLFLEVFPRSNPGVIAHIHEIFLPRDLPKERIPDPGVTWMP